MKYLMAIVSLMLIGESVRADAITDQAAQVIEDTKEAGGNEFPVSDNAKAKLNIISGDVVKNNADISEDKYKEISFDCKTWQRTNLDKEADETSSFKLKDVYFKDQTDSIGKFNDRMQAFVIFLKGETSYFKITNDAIIGLFGNSRLVYRPIKSRKIYPGMLGFGQALTLIAVETGDRWSLYLRDGKPELLFNLHFHGLEHDKILGKYLFLHCSIDKNCNLISRTGNTRVVPLKVNTPEHLKLKDMGLFNSNHLGPFDKLCQSVSSPQFREEFNAEHNSFKKKCSEYPVTKEPNLSAIGKACGDLSVRLRPMLQSFQ